MPLGSQKTNNTNKKKRGKRKDRLNREKKDVLVYVKLNVDCQHIVWNT